MSDQFPPANMFEKICEIIDAPEVFSEISIKLLPDRRVVITTIEAFAPVTENDEDPNDNPKEAEIVAEWPQWDAASDVWVDKNDDEYDADIHAWNRELQRPSVKGDGTFRKKINRGNGPQNNSDNKQQTKKPKTVEISDVSAEELAEAVEKNVVLGAIQTHINAATTTQRLDELAAMPQVQMLSERERAIVDKLFKAKRSAIIHSATHLNEIQD